MCLSPISLIIGSGLTTIGNYVLVQAPANATAFKVNPAQLVVTAKDAARDVGQSNPTFSVDYSGLVLGQTPSVVSGLLIGTSATNASPSGQYPIVPSGASAQNYTISYVEGVLTISPSTTQLPTPASLFAITQDPTASGQARLFGALPSTNNGLLSIAGLYAPSNAELAAVSDLASTFVDEYIGQFGATGLAKDTLVQYLTKFFVLSLPRSLLNDPQSVSALRSFIIDEFNHQSKRLSRSNFTHDTLNLALDKFVDVTADISADAVAHWVQTKYNLMSDDWQISTTKLWVKIGIEDSYAAVSTGAQTGGASVVAATAQVAVGEILDSLIQTGGVFYDATAGFVREQSMINKVIASSNESSTPPAIAERQRAFAANLQKDLSQQIREFYSISTLNPL